MKRLSPNIIIALALIVIAVSLRVLPHPANFAPITAIAIFGGAVLSRRLGVWTPLIAMMISDAIIGFHSLIFLTWACFAIIALVSNAVLKKPSLARGAGMVMGSSLFFFIVTNFGVWAEGGMYAKTWAGLVQCYTMALPFFKNTMLSDITYTVGLFGIYALAVALSSKLLSSSRHSA